MAAAENIQRQIAIAVVIAVEEAPFLRAVQGIVGGVEIEDDFLRRALVRLEEEIDEQRFDGGGIVADLVIARRLRLGALQPVQRRFARHRRAVLAPRRKLAGEHAEHRIVAQMVVVVQILVAQREGVHALPDQSRHRMLDQIGPARVGKAGGEAADQPQGAVRLPQQQGARVRGDRAAIETGHNFVALDGCEIEKVRATLCSHRGAP